MSVVSHPVAFTCIAVVVYRSLRVLFAWCMSQRPPNMIFCTWKHPEGAIGWSWPDHVNLYNSNLPQRRHKPSSAIFPVRKASSLMARTFSFFAPTFRPASYQQPLNCPSPPVGTTKQTHDKANAPRIIVVRRLFSSHAPRRPVLH